MLGYVGVQRGALDARAHAGLKCHDVGRAGATVQPQLADVFSGAVDAVGDFALTGVKAAVGAQLPGQDEVERVAMVTFLNEQRALGVAAHFTGPRQGAQ